MSFLKNHPFAVEAHFKSTIVLTYALPKTQLESLLPKCLTLDTHNDQWAFVAVALVQTENLRPKGFPKFMGNDFFLAGYRIFVRYTTNEGKRLRGLFILKSETDKKKMAFFGNIFTHYNYTAIDIKFSETDENINIYSNKSGLEIEIRKNENADLPKGSVFEDWKTARRFAGPLPFTFTYNEFNNEVTIIEGVRQNWVPKPIEVLKAELGFIEQEKFKGAILANAFINEDIPYHWKKGKTEIWKDI
ncbi:MAG: hypothetical protein EOO44_21210 [Flavobacterium sp.]|nr:MAG: hypothetical protein EOO44_21210 [Flavobacterium sp.]